MDKKMKVYVELPAELHADLMRYITATWPTQPHGKLKQVLTQAVQEYMASHTRTLLAHGGGVVHTLASEEVKVNKAEGQGEAKEGEGGEAPQVSERSGEPT